MPPGPVTVTSDASRSSDPERRELVRAVDQRGRRGRQVRGMCLQRARRREARAQARDVELEQALRPDVLEAMPAEVADREVVGERARDRLGRDVRKQRLAAVARGGDARRPMDLDADVRVADRDRDAGMDADPDANLRIRWPGLRRPSARWASAAARTPASGSANTTANESPSVDSSRPSCRRHASRRSAWWRASRAGKPSPSSRASRVLPSMSLNRNVIADDGASRSGWVSADGAVFVPGF